MSPALLHRVQGIAGLLLLPTLLLPWLRRTGGGEVEWVPGYALAREPRVAGVDGVPLLLAVLVVVALTVVTLSAAWAWWRRSLNASMLAGLAALFGIFDVVASASTRRQLDVADASHSAGPGLMLAVLLLAVVVVTVLALLVRVKPAH
ncbi:hypothetical protein [Nocardioides daphniae]|uniref:Uncharacterized protein n=1 Tax=Nocardioides daphniae TaxID=402297 RepID=A0A4P7UA82_9ACTN|nr:hypothetical protein [Nocardioides daphniae]QCC76138.1 hypothetical protein E2C04_01065 [Nocardioides daphniae]GGD09741.1 hypothetical protein GCM10007231_05740 [Nocardioides daphniae]